jgi:hypothetical protein
MTHGLRGLDGDSLSRDVAAGIRVSVIAREITAVHLRSNAMTLEEHAGWPQLNGNFSTPVGTETGEYERRNMPSDTL